MSAATLIEAILLQERKILIAAIVMMTGMGVLYTLFGVGMEMSAIEMTRMAVRDPGMRMPPQMWTPAYFGLMLLMWWVMMMAMMLPSATPMILFFAAVNRNKARQKNSVVPTLIFVSGYLLVWGFFGVLATLAQWVLTTSGLMDGMMRSNSQLLGGILLISTGVYQFTSVKEACLHRCQSPIQFVMGHWSPGHSGAMKMGLLHGFFCLGCCWLLMGLLFFGGVMNIAWIGGLAIYVLIEKIGPTSNTISKIAGAILFVWGGIVLWRFML